MRKEIGLGTVPAAQAASLLPARFVLFADFRLAGPTASALSFPILQRLHPLPMSQSLPPSSSIHACLFISRPISPPPERSLCALNLCMSFVPPSPFPIFSLFFPVSSCSLLFPVSIIRYTSETEQERTTLRLLSSFPHTRRAMGSCIDWGPPPASVNCLPNDWQSNVEALLPRLQPPTLLASRPRTRGLLQ